MKNHAFTLIELLVVVLIIGILAAIAVPKYQKAVLKSYAVGALPMLQNICQAQELYYLSNNEYADNLDKLDVFIESRKKAASWMSMDEERPSEYIYSCHSVGVCGAKAANMNMPILQCRLAHYEPNSEYDIIPKSSLVCVTARGGGYNSTEMATSVCKSISSNDPISIPGRGDKFYLLGNI